MRSLTLDRTIALILICLLAAIAIRVPVDTDTWWHIRSGEVTLTQGMIYTDPFSHTKAGEPWINHSWGAQVIMYGVYQVMGNVGLSLLQAVLAVGGMMILYRVSPGPALTRAFIMILGAAAAAVFWSARPQMFTFFLSCLVLALLIDVKRGRDRLWVLPIIMGIWGNLHAGFSIGFLLMGGALVGEILNRLTGLPALTWPKIGKLAAMIALSVLALLVNPYGAAMLAVPFQTVNIGALRQYIQEWNSPDFQGRETWPFIALVLALLGAAWVSRAPFDWTFFSLVGGSLFLALLYGRNVSFFATIATPVLSDLAANALRERGWLQARRAMVTPRSSRLNMVLVGLVVAGVGLYALGVLLPVTIQQAQERFLPIKAVDYLNENNPPGPMFNSYNWGGYLMFAAPQYKVFIDGRTDLYGDFLSTYYDTAQGWEGWQNILDQYDIRLVVVEATSGLADVLRKSPDWTLAYEDESIEGAPKLAAIFTRSEG